MLEFKYAVAHNHWLIVQRRVAYADVSEMSPTMIKRVLLQLTPNDYYDGPSADRNRPGEYLWIFHRANDGHPYLYIKLKMQNGLAKVISFHETLYGGEKHDN